jgi:hypothetical protein
MTRSGIEPATYFLYGHNLFLFFKIHSSSINTFLCMFHQLLHALQECSFLNVVKLPCRCTLILRSCTCRLLSLPQVKISLKRAAFSNSGINAVCSDKGACKMNVIVAVNVFKIGICWRCAVSFSPRLL